MDTRTINKLIKKYKLPYKVGVRKDRDFGHVSCLYYVDTNGSTTLVATNPGEGTYGPLIEELSKVGPAGQALYLEFRRTIF